MLLAGRAIQGVGSGGINMIIEVIISDLVPLRQRGYFMSIVLLIYALGLGTGPLIGGSLAQHVGWRWVFYINLPIGGTSLGLLYLLLKVKDDKTTPLKDKKNIDYVGNTIIIASTISVLYALTVAGSSYPWGAWQTLVPLLIGFGGFCAFICFEASPLCPHPVVPLRFFMSRTRAVIFTNTLLTSILSYWMLYFRPLYFQAVLESDPTFAGVQMLPSTLGSLLVSAGCSAALSWIGRYKIFHNAGFGGVHAILDRYSSPARWVMFQILTGSGIAKLKDPVLGIDVMLSNMRAAREHRSLQTFEERFYSIGPAYSSKLLFGAPIIITMEPENIRAVISQNFQDYALAPFRQPALKHFLGDGIFTTDGAKWQSSRALLRPNFARDQIADLNALENHAQDLFALLPRDGVTTVNLQEHLFRFTLDSATEFLFGQSVHSLRRQGTRDTDSLDAQFETAFAAAQAECMDFVALGPLAKYARVKSQKQVEIVHRYIDQAIAFRQKYDEGGGDRVEKDRPKYLFLQEIAKQTTDRTRLRYELLNVLMAGRDTTASLLGNLFFMITKSPEIMRKLQREVDGLNGARPSYSTLREMPYLKACLRESLRLHPVVPVNTRIAVTDTVLPRGGGPDRDSPVFVAKGTAVGWSVHAMHRRKDLYGPDADEFRPERWETLVTRSEYLPFNGGPRICLGQQYALTEASYLTIRMLQEYEMGSMDPGEWEEELAITACNRRGCRVALRARNA
ncbi:Cytochrome P450 monooxygenase fsdH [Colletotrichum trifolii]|uniref:Cytochrome P450 monooxygenase fsdH n=1 Tax=Colletotrichum trifolii TaxID=5466 RepID=A0A4R8QM54_COLTR|nr:Cytochrome P450 monooxygenase fsdH [Colletotrichum trifolii]